MAELGVMFHCYPIDDLRAHDTDGVSCWCKPRVEEDECGTLFIHNSLDGREKYETGERRLH